MGDRMKPHQLWLISGAVTLVSVLSPRSLQAQTLPAPPPLEGLVHSFNLDQPEATAYSLWNVGQSQRHEVWFRVLGGDADYRQRLRVYKEQAPPREPDTLPPPSELVYEQADNIASEWVFLGTEDSFFTYYFDGDNRPNDSSSWGHAEAVRVSKTIYTNGDLYEISFEDLNTLDDYNDLEIEVLLVRR
ncbi:MAG TPA: hypothetical protein V6D02_02205 [Candidatus Obscuribacterales bacterium]